MSFKELSEGQWTKVQEFMNWTPPKERGTKRTSFRKIWNSIFYILCHGCRWSDLPRGKSYAAKTTAFRWLKRWKIERAFAWLKRKYLRLMLKWERLVLIWKAFTTLSLFNPLLVEYFSGIGSGVFLNPQHYFCNTTHKP